MKTFSALLVLALSTSLQAQTSSTSTSSAGEHDSAKTETTSVATIDAKPAAKQPSALILGFKSTIDSFRNKNYGVSGARVMSAKNELFAGYRHPETGWGGFLNGVQSYKAYNEAAAGAKYTYKPNWSQGDASITLLHPDFYKSSDLTLFGQLRYYFRTTPRSRDAEIDQLAYYFRMNAKLADNHEIYNELIPRYFNVQQRQLLLKNEKTYTTYYVEDTMIYNYKINSVVKVGAKQWTQYEVHSNSAPGFSFEAGPSATFTVNPHLNISSSLSFPIAIKNSVFDAASIAKPEEALASLLIQARF